MIIPLNAEPFVFLRSERSGPLPYPGADEEMAAIAFVFPKTDVNASFVSFPGKQRAGAGVMEGNIGATGLQEKFSSPEPGGCSETKCQDRSQGQYFTTAAHAGECQERAKASGTSTPARPPTSRSTAEHTIPAMPV